MSLRFQRHEHIPLANPPISEAICQVRFPPILKIAKETPIDMQERVRHSFPELVSSLEMPFSMTEIGLVPAPDPSFRVWRFARDEQASFIALATSFLALSTSRYKGWNSFIADMQLAVEAVTDVYAPPYATRLGLRFVNLFSTNKRGLDSAENLWGMFRPDLTVLLRQTEWDQPLFYQSQVIIPDGECLLALRTVHQVGEDDVRFTLDLDYYKEGQLQWDDLPDLLETFHEAVYGAFRWCLTEAGMNSVSASDEKE